MLGMPKYIVVSIDNARVGQGGIPVQRGEFATADAALDHAKELVDQALQALQELGAAESAQELMARYMRFGSEVPMIYGEPRVGFHAFQYAREQANAIFATAARLGL